MYDVIIQTDEGGAALAVCSTRASARYILEEVPIRGTVTVPGERFWVLGTVGSQGTDMWLDFQPDGHILLGGRADLPVTLVLTSFH